MTDKIFTRRDNATRAARKMIDDGKASAFEIEPRDGGFVIVWITIAGPEIHTSPGGLPTAVDTSPPSSDETLIGDATRSFYGAYKLPKPTDDVAGMTPAERARAEATDLSAPGPEPRREPERSFEEWLVSAPDEAKSPPRRKPRKPSAAKIEREVEKALSPSRRAAKSAAAPAGKRTMTIHVAEVAGGYTWELFADGEPIAKGLAAGAWQAARNARRHSKRLGFGYSAEAIPTGSISKSDLQRPRRSK